MCWDARACVSQVADYLIEIEKRSSHQYIHTLSQLYPELLLNSTAKSNLLQYLFIRTSEDIWSCVAADEIMKYSGRRTHAVWKLIKKDARSLLSLSRIYTSGHVLMV